MTYDADKNGRPTLDGILGDIRRDDAGADALEGAATRVRAKLDEALRARSEQSPEHAALRSCDDFAKVLPAFAADRLGDDRRLLVEDHVRGCFRCRRALTAIRRGDSAAKTRPAKRTVAKSAKRRTGDWTWAIAAATLVGVAFVGLGYQGGWFSIRTGGIVRLDAVDGTMMQVADLVVSPAQAGQEIEFEEGRAIRTAKDSGAVFSLEDGSRVEMNERSELYVTRKGGDHTIHLTRGDIIVQASDQGSGHLFVETNDCDVAVTGTVFAISHGTKGSRVSVIEGEVVVDHRRDRDTEVLLPGSQTVTSDSMRRVSVGEDIAWSRELDDHMRLLATYYDLEIELEKRLSDTERRFDTDLLDLAPADTAIYIALPNITTAFVEFQKLLEERLATDPVLEEAWDRNFRGFATDGIGSREVDEVFARIGRLGEAIGSEIVIAIPRGVDGPEEPVILTTLADEGALRALVDEMNIEFGDEDLRFVEDPFALPTDSSVNGLLLHTSGNRLVAAVSAGALQRTVSRMASDAAPFKQAPLYADLADAYRDGVGILVGIDVHGLMEAADLHDAADVEGAAVLGFDNVRHVLIRRTDLGDVNETRVRLSVDGERHGVLSWIAEPAPMGSLEFVSPDATIASALVMQSPAELFDKLLRNGGPDMDAALDEFRTRFGIDAVEDLAAPLGGEVAFALDGPILPSPAWKVIAEVYDPTTFQSTLERLVASLDDILREEGRAGVSLVTDASGNRAFHEIRSEDLGMSMHYTFSGGYVVIGSNRALLERALDMRQSGLSLAKSRRLAQALPEDRHGNVSAMLYHNVGRILGNALDTGLAEALGMSQEQLADLRAVAARGNRPSAFVVYGHDDGIEIVGNDRGNFLLSNPLGRLFDVTGLMQVGSSLQRSAHALEPAAPAVPGAPAVPVYDAPVGEPQTGTGRDVRSAA